MATLTASAESVSASFPGYHSKENWAALLETNLDLVKQRMWNRQFVGLEVFNRNSTTKDHVINQYHYGVGLVPVSRSAGVLPVDQASLGHQNTITMVQYRLAMLWEQEIIEDDQYEVVGPRQSKFLDAMNKTIEYLLSDVFNRGFGTSGAPILCGDGMYLFDASRNKPHPGVAEWSNVETSAALTSNSLFTMEQNFSSNTDERGHNAPLNLQEIIIPKALERIASDLAKSNMNPENALHQDNYYRGLTYRVWHYLTSAMAWFGSACSPQDDDNELKFYWRIQPNTKTYDVGGNPDIVAQRVRARFGYGCDIPYTWRGNAGA